MRCATSMVDTLHWSGGNTSLDALACALPIVTLPGRFMRGRQSAGMLRLMGIDELVARDADDYVRIVARLVERRCVAQRIDGAHPRGAGAASSTIPRRAPRSPSFCAA